MKFNRARQLCLSNQGVQFDVGDSGAKFYCSAILPISNHILDDFKLGFFAGFGYFGCCFSFVFLFIHIEAIFPVEEAPLGPG